MFPERNDSGMLILDGKLIFFDKKFRSTNNSAFNINHIFFRSRVMFSHLNIQAWCMCYRFDSLKAVLWTHFCAWCVYFFDPSHNSINSRFLSLNAFVIRFRNKDSICQALNLQHHSRGTGLFVLVLAIQRKTLFCIYLLKNLSKNNFHIFTIVSKCQSWLQINGNTLN